MKTILLLLTVAIFTPLASFSQEDIPRKTRYFDINNNKDQQENFDYVVDYLLDHDFMIDDHDKELGTIITRPKDFKRHSAFYKFRVKDSVITVSGKFRQSQTQAILWGSTYRDGFEEIIKRSGVSNRPGEKKAFDQMYELSKDLGKDISFRP